MLHFAQNRFQQIDWDKHVAGQFAIAPQCIGDKQAANANQLAALVKQRRTRVVANRRAGENGRIQVVLPVAGEGALAHHLGHAHIGFFAIGLRARGGHQGFPGSQFLVAAQCHWLHIAQRQQRLDQAKAGSQIVGHGLRGQSLVVLRHDLDGLGFEHQVADGQNQAVSANHHTRPAAFLPQRLNRAGIFRHADPDPHHSGVGFGQGIHGGLGCSGLWRCSLRTD